MFSDVSRFLGDIDADRTPGQTPSATNTPHHSKLLHPVGKLVGHPLAIAGFGRLTNAATMDVREIGGKTRIPALPPFRRFTGKISYFLYCRTEAGRANQCAVSTRQTAFSGFLPTRVVEIAIQDVGEILGFKLRLDPEFRLLEGIECQGDILTCGGLAWNPIQ